MIQAALSIPPELVQEIALEVARLMVQLLPTTQPATAATLPKLMLTREEAEKELGIPSVALRKAVADGRVTEIVLQGSGGTRYDPEELASLARWLFDEKKKGRLSPHYLSRKKLAQTSDSHAILPQHSARSRTRGKNPLPAIQSAPSISA